MKKLAVKKEDKVVREIPPDVVQQLVEREQKIKLREKLNSNIKLEALKELVTKHPQVIIGGSVAMIMQGHVLERFYTGINDVDIILPYYMHLSEDSQKEIIELDDKSEENDFDVKTSYNGLLLDIAIDPKSKYIEVEYEGSKFKVVPMYTIFQYKMKYKRRLSLQNCEC